MIDANVAPVDSAAADDDEPPMPLTTKVPIPQFPIDALPEPIAAMVRAIADATQTDPAMAGVSALSTLSACTGGHALIELRGGWREPLHLYTATIAHSGERKSAVQQFMVRPLFDEETELAKNAASERIQSIALKEAAEKGVERAKNAVASASLDKDKTDTDVSQAKESLSAQVAYAESLEVPAIPRILADDITPEAAGTVMAEQGGRLAIISAEGGIFDIIAGRYSRLPNMDVWLKGHSGDPVRIDRKNRAPEHIRHPALTIGLMIQPSVLADIGARNEFRGRGLLARFLYAYPISKVGHRDTEAPEPDQVVIESYTKSVSDLVSGLIEWSSDPIVLTLTNDARQLVGAIMAEIEPTLAGTGELANMADWGSKYVGAIGRIAGILHLAEHGPESYANPVNTRTMKNAIKLGRYFKACAINAFAEMGSDQSTADAVYLLDRIERLENDELSERDIHRAARSRFPSKADLKPSLTRLIDHGYLIPLDMEATEGPGRKPSQRYKVIGTDWTHWTESRP